MPTRSRRTDSGAAVAEFVLVGALLSLVFASVLQLGLALHVRNTVTDSAVAGARQAALADQRPVDGRDLTRELITVSVGPAYAEQIDVREETVGGVTVVTVTVTTPVPVFGLVGPQEAWNLSGRAIAEDLVG
ncbi:hypothetical protein GCM10022261_03700 [Brevibacterium daeguense]|uniref:TadE-like domain-containing protein n=1 Tax=Brevibacterium daeguense TaxID=909936 RepID=A0ABP8EFU2_9MICO|nr:TadE family protein [Brevibacterium daeguense]